MEFWSPSGELVDVPDAEAPARIAEGYRPTRDALPVQYDADDIRWVYPQDIDAALAAGGQVITSHQMVARQEEASIRREARESPGAAVVEGVARGFTLGASDVALRGTSTRAAAEAAARMEEHPWLSLVGELAGIAGATVATGGIGGAAAGAARGSSLAARATGALGRIATAPARLAEAAGARTAAALGGSTTAARVAGLAAEGAVQTGLIEAGRTTLTARDAEDVAARLVSGAVEGAAGGAAVGVLTGIGGRIWRAASPRVEDLAREQTARAIGMRAADYKKAMGRGSLEDGKRVVQEMIDEVRSRGLLRAGDDIAETSARISAARDAVGEEIGALRQQAARALRGEADAAKGAADIAAARDAARVSVVRRDVEEALAPLMRSEIATTRRQAVKAMREIESLWKPRWEAVPDASGRRIVRAIDDAPIDLDALVQARQSIDALAYPRPIGGGMPPPPPPHAEALIAVRNALEKRIEQITASALPHDMAGAYEAAKRSFSRLQRAAKVADGAAAADMGSRAISLSDTIAGAAGAVSAAVPALASGNLVGLATGAAGAFVFAGLHRIARRRAASAMEFALAASKRPGFAATPKRQARRAALALSAQRDERERRSQRERLRDLASQIARDRGSGRPAALADAVAPGAPAEVRMAAAAQIERAREYLQASAPAGVWDSDGDPAKRGVVDPVAARAWERSSDVVADPLFAADLMARGRLTPEHVRALEATHPQALRDMREELLAQLEEREKRGEPPLPLSQLTQIAILLGRAASPLQATAPTAAPPPPPPMQRAPAAALRAAERAGSAVAQAATLGSDAAIGEAPL